MKTKTKRTGLTPTPTNKKLAGGLTLIELIIVVAIIAIMAAAVYVVRGPADKKANIELTKSTIELLCAALEQYHHFYNEFPDPNGNLSSPGYYPAGCGDSDPNNAEKLAYRLSLCPDAQVILNRINNMGSRDNKMTPRMVKDRAPADGYPEYVDAWGMEFRYQYDKDEKWNFPLITSAGPDREFDTGDDITSRK
jgi:prepilin-type N-terminal cleavage/methylation domain-containing protein